MSVPTPPVSLPRGTGQRRTAPIPPFSGAETPPPLPGVRCRPAAGRGQLADPTEHHDLALEMPEKVSPQRKSGVLTPQSSVFLL